MFEKQVRLESDLSDRARQCELLQIENQSLLKGIRDRDSYQQQRDKEQP
jgi:hypothetical protein